MAHKKLIFSMPARADIVFESARIFVPLSESGTHRK